jgi:hypothetical protein
MEMPYVNVVQHGENIKFDMELEKYAHDLEGFKAILRHILNSETISDKYGNEILLSGHDEKLKFLTSLNDTSFVNMFLSKYHNTTLLNVVKDLK